MSNSIVRQALESRLAAYAQANGIPVAYENDDFTKPTSGIWLECFLIPNLTLNRETTASHTRLLGLFQVNVWGRKGEGSADTEAAADAVAALFPVVPKTGVISIEKPPHVGRALLDDSGWTARPVLMSYRYDA